MSKWQVRLKGEKFDLEELPSRFNSQELTIKEENGFYYLESSDYNSLTSADEVRKRSHKIIEILNGTMKLDMDNFQLISEDGITFIEDDGKRHHYVYLEGSVKPRAKVSASLTVISNNGTEKEEKIPKKPSLVESWVKSANTNKEISDALNFYKRDTWIDLYKVYEIIRDDVGGNIKEEGWASKKQISRFTQTSQSRDALGDKARHATKKHPPPEPPMSFNEAKLLIKGILLKWIQSKS